MRKRRLKGSAEAIGRLSGDPRRGQVYQWLDDEHDAILRRTVGDRIPWKTLLLEVQALGLTNADGKVPQSEEALRSTFNRVRARRKRLDEAKQQRKPKPRPTNTPPPVVRLTTPETRHIPTARPEPAPVTKLQEGDWLWEEILRRSNKRV